MKIEKFKVLLYLKKSGMDKNGKAPIMGRITVNRTMAQFSCKLSCTPSLWNPRSNLSYSPLAALELYVKQSNSPFCAPQLILFQKRKHRVKEKKTQHRIQYSVIQFFFRGYFLPLKK